MITAGRGCGQSEKDQLGGGQDTFAHDEVEV